MTTIAYRNGIMAADTRAWAGHKGPVGSKVKVRRLPDGSLAGVTSGQPGASEAILDWLVDRGGLKDINKAEDHPKNVTVEGVEILIVDRWGCGFLANAYWTFTGPLDADYFAIGSGGQYATAALEVGAKADVAVNIACKLDPLSAPPITIIGHDRA